MDLSKAFDVIQQPLLLAKLKAYGLDEDSCALLRDYLSNEQQRVKIGDTFSSWETKIIIITIKTIFKEEAPVT